MGIANTTATSCLVAAFTGADADAVLGRGAAIDDASLVRKREVIADALTIHADTIHRDDPLETLAAVGGLEHAALVGVILAAAGRGVPVVLDGVITNAAALVAARLAPDVIARCIAGHRSTEPAATLALAALGLDPVLDLQMRLGEGTGGLLAVAIVQAAARVLADVASISDL
jgi:nicotinate-nucleotide--dimethylbenzimidazole phosphoribosyltransferase